MSTDDQYPHVPGHQDTDTSEAAAVSMIEAAHTIRGRAFKAIKEAGANGLTAEETAIKLGMPHRYAMSPRLSELYAKGLIGDSGQRRKNTSGREAIAWVATTSIDDLLSW